MSQAYIAYTFKVNPVQPATEILIAELGYAGFESFVENQDGVTAYIQKEQWHNNVLDDVFVLNNSEFTITYTIEEIEQVNWNEEWEKNFNPITVDNRCAVRAPFHEKPNTQYDIVIEPKMSFGTGHHETTYMMLKLLLNEPVANKRVLDMGCGTGVLAILAGKMGASYVEAIDIDSWCYENALENVNRNNCNNIVVKQGDAKLLSGSSFDVILANINRNILLEDIAIYAQCLTKNGVLMLSGFYKDDLPLITKECEANGLKFEANLEKNHWIAAKYVNL